MQTSTVLEAQAAQDAPLPARLVRIHHDEDQARYRAGFIGAYQTVFARAPYHERFSPAEAEGVWHRLTRVSGNVTVLAVTPTDKVVGFGIGIPMRHQRDVTRRLAGLLDPKHTFYFAELGVLPEYRSQGLGGALVQARLAALDPGCWTSVVLRASAARSGNLELYTSMGFSETGETMDVSALRTDGRVSTDRRVFLHGTLSRLRLDDGAQAP